MDIVDGASMRSDWVLGNVETVLARMEMLAKYRMERVERKTKITMR